MNNMSEQQFVIIDKEWISYTGGYAYVVSNGECEFSLWEDKEDTQKVCDYLNEKQATIISLREEMERRDKRAIKEYLSMPHLNPEPRF